LPLNVSVTVIHQLLGSPSASEVSGNHSTDVDVLTGDDEPQGLGGHGNVACLQEQCR
jgi:hypothetical protein